MKLFYRGKNAIVTGASGGMGLEISKMLSENNINVLMLDVKSPGKTFLNENENPYINKRAAAIPVNTNISLDERTFPSSLCLSIFRWEGSSVFSCPS